MQLLETWQGMYVQPCKSKFPYVYFPRADANYHTPLLSSADLLVSFPDPTFMVRNETITASYPPPVFDCWQ